jgi:hypothetical protein
VLAGLGRRFRGPTLCIRFQLQTDITRQIYRRDFVYVSQQLHALEASRRVQGLPRENLNAALASISHCLASTRGVLLDAASQLRALIDLNGLSDAHVEFRRPEAILVTIVSPHAREYMGVLEAADDALAQLERAWLLGLVDPLEKSQRVSDSRKAIQAVKEAVRDQRQVIGGQVRDVNARRAKESEMQAPAMEGSMSNVLLESSAQEALDTPGSACMPWLPIPPDVAAEGWPPGFYAGPGAEANSP